MAPCSSCLTALVCGLWSFVSRCRSSVRRRGERRGVDRSGRPRLPNGMALRRPVWSGLVWIGGADGPGGRDRDLRPIRISHFLRSAATRVPPCGVASAKIGGFGRSQRMSSRSSDRRPRPGLRQCRPRAGGITSRIEKTRRLSAVGSMGGRNAGDHAAMVWLRRRNRRRQWTRWPASAPASGERAKTSGPPGPAASTMPSDSPNFILRGLRFAQ